MRRVLLLFLIPILAVVFAFIARPYSLGERLGKRAEIYSQALSAGRTGEALSMMDAETAEGLSIDFLSGLKGATVPSDFRYDGSDARGFRMAGFAGDEGSRVIWFSTDQEGGIYVTNDTALDNLLGSAVMLCRENAYANPDGCCPVSGKPYSYDAETGTVVCPDGHLGDGITLSSDACALRRDSVAAELADYLQAGYPYPENLEEIFTISGEEYGRRGGYRCPDNGYKYYELRDGTIFCPFHEESSEAVVSQ
ncbi:MAG: hypothetical protein U9P42_05225 [Candidatus Fermentibacteria bacterium]|nr:hypothetical protein [Candidatus Fermentibacteria bacterium]